MRYWSEFYAYPYFLQSWSLFAPSPTENYFLFVRYENNGQVKEELLGDLLAKHQEHPFTGREAIVLSLCNSTHHFEKNTELQKPLNGPMDADGNFKILERYALRYLNHNRHLNLHQVGLALHAGNIKTGKTRVYYNSAFAKPSN